MLRKVVFVLVASLLLVNHSSWIPGDVYAKGENIPPLSLEDAQEVVSQSRGFFTENKGQWDPEILFVGSTDFGKVAFTRDAIYYQLIKMEEPAQDPFDPEQPRDGLLADHFHDRLDPLYREPTVYSSNIIELSFVGGGSAVIEGLDLLPHYHNYFIGNDSSKWATECRNFAQVSYTDVWEGIDLSYFFSPEGLKYEYYVHPHAQMEDLKVMVEGAELQENNNYLSMITPLGSLQDDQLLVYRQDTGLTISASFTVEDNFFSFQGIPEERSETIVIDPLVYSTFLGGNHGDSATSIALDRQGNLYVGGATESDNFPTTKDSFQPKHHEHSYLRWYAFLTKINTDGTSIIYSTFLGGHFGHDRVNSIAVDSHGNPYLVGLSNSEDFPITDDAFQKKHGGGRGGTRDAFISKLSASGSSLFYSTFLGGNDEDIARSIAIDSQGNAFISGETLSKNFPTTSGAYQTTYKGGDVWGGDGFILKLNPKGNALIYSTYLGGDVGDKVNSIAIDSQGNAYVAGSTKSNNFPITPNAFCNSLNGYESAFVAKINYHGNKLLYSTYLGGSASEDVYSIAIDNHGNVFIAGTTFSKDFPTTDGAFQKNHGGGDKDAFISKINASGSSLVYSTYLGGNDSDIALSVAIDNHGNVFIAGTTFSKDFPITDDAFQKNHGGGDRDAFISKINASGSSLVYSTYLGGNDTDSIRSIAIDSQSNIYAAGMTSSINFPVTVKAFQENYGGGHSTDPLAKWEGHWGDAFVTIVNTQEPDYPILLVHGFQMLPYNPLEVMEPLIKSFTGQTTIGVHNTDILPVTPSRNHNVYMVRALNENYRSVFVSDYASILMQPSSPLTSTRFITLDDIRFYAGNLKKEIDVIKLSTHLDKVNVIAHSMGGLVARTYIEEKAFDSEFAKRTYLLGTHRSFLPKFENDVHRLIMLGTPNHGTQAAKVWTNGAKVAQIAFKVYSGTAILALIEEIASDKVKEKLYEMINSHLPFNILGFNPLDHYIQNLSCMGQMDTASSFLKILNYESNSDWNIEGNDILQQEVHYHILGGIIPDYFFGFATQNSIDRHFQDLSNKLISDGNRVNLFGQSDGLVPANSVRVYDDHRMSLQYGNLNHMYIHADHSQILRNQQSYQMINKLLVSPQEKLDSSDYWKSYGNGYSADFLYRIIGAMVFSPASLRLYSGEESVGFDFNNSVENAFVDYIEGTIQWFNPSSDQFTYRLEGFENGTYGVRFTSVDFKETQSVPLVYETHGLPTSEGRVDQIHIDWNSKDVKMESDINGDGVIDQVITAPGAPSSLSAIFEQSLVRLTWQASRSGSNPLRGYSIFRRGVQEDEFVSIGFVTAGSNLAFIDSSIVKDKSYVYYIQAVDAQNMSSISSNFALIDREGPEIEITHPTPDVNLSSSSVEVRGFVRDMSGVRAVWVNNVEAYYDKSNESFVSRPIQVDQAQFTITVKAEDMAGNQSIKSIKVRKKLPTIVELTIGSTVAIVTKNGQMQMMNIDLAPFVRDARTFVPLRFIAEAFGAKVDWFYDPLGKSKGRIEITFTRADTSMVVMKMRDLEQVVIIEEYAAGSVTPRISRYTMDVAPFIVKPQDRTVVPIRFIAEGFGARVDWEPHTKSITITMET